MAYQNILYEKIDTKIAKVTMNRPEKRNAEDYLMLEEMRDAFIEADSDEDVHVIILAGAGEDFSAGHDLAGFLKAKEMKTKHTGGEWLFKSMEWLFKLEDYIFLNQCLIMRNVSKPSIAMVQGHCIAGGWMNAAMCDLIVASDDAKFGDPVVRMAPAAVEILFHPYDVGFRKAKEMLWTGDQITAEEARQLGFVSRVVPREKLEEETLALARRIAMNMPVAVSLVKRSINRAWEEMGQLQAWHYHFLIHQLSHASDESKAWRAVLEEAVRTGTVKELLKKRDEMFKADGNY